MSQPGEQALSIVNSKDSGSPTAGKMLFTQIATHAALRRSDLKGRTISFEPNNGRQGSKATLVVGPDTKLGLIQGTKKDLSEFKSTRQAYITETGSQMTAKLAETEL